MDDLIRAVLEEIQRKVTENVSEDHELETIFRNDKKLGVCLRIKLPEYRGMPDLEIGSLGKAAILIMDVIEQELVEERRYTYTVTERHTVRRYDLYNPSSIDEVTKDVVNYVKTAVLPKGARDERK